MFYNNEISIFDTTLRDGEQTPNVSFTNDQKLKIAKKLDELNVDIIEAGFPSSSKGEKKSVEEVVNLGLEADICGLSRAVKSDIDACMDTGVDMIHLFISTSDIQLEHTIKKNKDEVKDIVSEKVSYIAGNSIDCIFSAMDATRTDQDFLIDVLKIAEDSGADLINIPDTVGVMKPKSMEKLVSDVHKEISVPLDVHCHNDFGLAVANTLSSIEGGAAQVQVTVNGLGERAGNASLQEVVMGIKSLLNDFNTNIATKKLYEISKIVERLSSIQILPNTPIVGENAFSHESGIHAQGIISDSKTFEPGVMTPEMVGHSRKLVAGKHVGRHSIKQILSNAGLNPNEEELMEIFERVKELGDKGKKITDADLYTISEIVMDSLKENIIELEELAVMTGTKINSTASITAKIKGEEKKSSDIGVGPVDAAIKATHSLLGGFPEITLKSFKVEAITGGSDALAEIIVEVEDEKGHSVTARSESEDIVKASVDALISGINRLLRYKK